MRGSTYTIRPFLPNSSRPIMLDTFCGVGGASVGYSRAGWQVVGIDKYAQPNYPFPFLKADASEALQALLDGQALTFTRHGLDIQLDLAKIAALHGSPPCQGYSTLAALHGYDWPMLVPETRNLFRQTGKPFIIENVKNAPVRQDITLCGEMFGLQVIRHRHFELGRWRTKQPTHIKHRGRVKGYRHGEYFEGYYYAVHGEGGGKGSINEWKRAMGMPWAKTRHEVVEAIPPAYTEWVGRRLLPLVK